MIPDHETNSVYLAAMLREFYPQLWQGLATTLNESTIPLLVLDDVPQVWLRDFLPVQTDGATFVRFRYEPDYLAGYEHLIPGEQVFQSITHLGRFVTSDINLDGGNVVASRDKVILTDKVFRENRRCSRQGLRRSLEQLFGVEQCISIPYEGGDLFGHSDGIVRFLDDDTVLINDYAGVNKTYGRRLKAVLKEHRLEYEELPYFIEKRTVKRIPSAVGSYINYLQVQGLIIVPAFGVPQDETALQKLESLFPSTRIIPLRCENLARKGGVLRCVSWCIKAKRKRLRRPDPTSGRAVSLS